MKRAAVIRIYGVNVKYLISLQFNSIYLFLFWKELTLF